MFSDFGVDVPVFVFSGTTYKSATIYNYCDIGTNFIDYVLDSTKNKQGKFTPGKHIPILNPGGGINKDVDYAFLGAWNFTKEIKNNPQLIGNSFELLYLFLGDLTKKHRALNNREQAQKLFSPMLDFQHFLFSLNYIL